MRLSASRHAAWPGAVLYATAGLSLLAALFHLLVTPEHFEEWWGYGAFILACAIFQGAYAAVVLRWPARRSSRWARASLVLEPRRSLSRACLA